MIAQDFFDAVERHPELEGVGLAESHRGAGPGLFIRHAPTGIVTWIPLASLDALEWPELEAMLTARREPEVLIHMTRVVGYFSRTSNWNVSKIGELRDRHRGNYAIES